MNVTFERPQALWLLVLAVPLVVLHLRWMRRRTVEVSSLAIWLDLGPAGAPRRGFRRLSEAVTLGCLLAALAGFAGAAASPVTGRPAVPATRLAIVLDASAAMNAADADGGTVFRAARARAAEAVARLGPGDEVVVWLAHDAAHVAVEPTRELERAAGAVSRLEPTLLGADLRGTVRLARLALRGFRDPRILVLTGPAGETDLGPDDGVATSVGVCGAGPRRNAGFARAALDPTDPGAVVVGITTTDGRPAARTLRVTRDGAFVSERSVDVPASGTATERVQLGDPGGRGGSVEIRLLPGDDFEPDDAVRLRYARRPPLRVVVTAPGRAPSPFLLDALRACGDLIDKESAGIASPDAPASAFASCDVVVAEGDLPNALPTDRPVLQFGAAGRDVADPVVWSVGTHPVLRGADLAPLRMESARVVAVPDRGVVLAETDGGPVAACGVREGARIVRFGFRPDATTLPLEPAFPILVRNSLVWLAGPPLLPPQVVAGGVFVLSEGLPPGIDRVWIEGPGAGEPVEARTIGGDVAARVPFPPPQGPWTVRLRGVPGTPESVVGWYPPEGFRVGGRPESVAAAPEARAAVAALPDRRGNADTRRRWAPWLAAFGATALCVGAGALGRRTSAAALPPSPAVRPV